MICKNCGKELEQGKIYCDFCGKAVQIVPDYNILDEEILPEIVEDPKLKKKREEERRLAEEKRNELSGVSEPVKAKEKTPEKSKKITRLTVLLIILCVLLLIEIVVYVLHNYHTSYGYYMEQAKALDSTDDYSGAIGFYELALEKTPGDRDAMLSIALDKYKQKDYAGSEDTYLTYIKKNPSDPEGYKGLLSVYGALNDYDKISLLKENAPEDIRPVFKDFVLATVNFLLPGGDYKDDTTVVMAPSEEGYSIYFTIDGTDPSKDNGALYTDPFVLMDGETVVKAVCVDDSGHTGRIRTEEYKITYEAPDRPVVAPQSGTYDQPTKINMSAGEDCKIYYTWDGSMPGVNSSKYSSPIDMPEGNNILSVIAVDKHGLSSSVLKLNYEYLP